MYYAKDLFVSTYGVVTILCDNEHGDPHEITVLGLDPFTCEIVGECDIEELEACMKTKEFEFEYESVSVHYKKVVKRSDGRPKQKEMVTRIIFKNLFQKLRLTKFLKLEGKNKKIRSFAFYNTIQDERIEMLLCLQDRMRIGKWFTAPSRRCDYRSLKLLDECMQNPKLKIHSFDIETSGLSPYAPDAEVLMIGACEGHVFDDDMPTKDIVWVNRGERVDQPSWFKARFPDVELRWFDGSAPPKKNDKMVNDWRQTMRKNSVVTGFNSQAFDMPYLWQHTHPSNRIFGKLNTMSRKLEVRNNSKQKGTMEHEAVEMDGILHIDMMQVATQQLTLPTYNLNAVSKHVLKGGSSETGVGTDTQKEDVKSSDIVPFFRSDDPEKFWKLVAYQILDARLPLKLLKTMNSYNFVAGFTRIVPVPPSYILEKGQIVRVFAYIKSVMRTHFPDWFIGNPTFKTVVDSFTFKGGFVLEPKAGVYKKFIDILDFMSLYPSIIIAHNLSFETVLEDVHAANRAIERGCDVAVFEVGENEFVYVLQQSETQPQGILPFVADLVLLVRRGAKADMKLCAPGSLKYIFFNILQLTVKVLANTIYGFCGAKFTAVFEPFIARAITAIGRNMIEATRDRLEDCEPDTVTIYGDTDSVMTLGPQFGGDFGAAKKYAKQLSDMYTCMHMQPHYLEDEGITKGGGKVGAIFTEKKKTYTYIIMDSMKITRKGLETDKREYPPVVSKICEELWDNILLSDSTNVKQETLELARASVQKFIRGDHPKEDWAISVKYNRTESSKPPHVILAERAAVETPDIAPVLSHRFKYVVCKTNKVCTELHEQMHIFEEFMRDGAALEIDTEYYWESKLRNVLERFFSAIKMPHAIKEITPTKQKNIVCMI